VLRRREPTFYSYLGAGLRLTSDPGAHATGSAEVKGIPASSGRVPQPFFGGATGA